MCNNNTINTISHGPKTLQNAVDSILNNQYDKNILVKEKFTIFNNSKDTTLSICNIQTYLIQIVGRLCERFASDLCLTFDELNIFTHNCVITEPNRWIIGIGIRENGVDSNTYIIHRLLDSINNNHQIPEISKYYRKILAIDITDIPDKDKTGGTRTFTLFDISHHIISIDKTDYV